MFYKYLDDYYKFKLTQDEICEIEGVKVWIFYHYLKDNNLLSRTMYYKKIDTGNDNLNELLKSKYTAIVSRCKERALYFGKEYMSIMEWVEFCNGNKELLLKMWNDFIRSGKNQKLSISVDRVDNEKDYTIDNVEFVLHGYNAWKRNIRPIKVLHNGELNHFFSCEESSRFYGLYAKRIGMCFAGKHGTFTDYQVEESTIEEVLVNTGYKNTKEYYESRILDTKLLEVL